MLERTLYENESCLFLTHICHLSAGKPSCYSCHLWEVLLYLWEKTLYGLSSMFFISWVSILGWLWPWHIGKRAVEMAVKSFYHGEASSQLKKIIKKEAPSLYCTEMEQTQTMRGCDKDSPYEKSHHFVFPARITSPWAMTQWLALDLTTSPRHRVECQGRTENLDPPLDGLLWQDPLPQLPLNLIIFLSSFLLNACFRVAFHYIIMRGHHLLTYNTTAKTVNTFWRVPAWVTMPLRQKQLPY